jgi:tetratricopeptide (TPR) repeat protein
VARFTAAGLAPCALGVLGLVTSALAQSEPAKPTEAAASSTPAAATASTPVAASEYDALVLRALAEYDAGRWYQARALFERAHALDPTARTLRTIGMTAFNQADYVGALRHLETALVDTRKPLTDEQRTHVLGLIDRANRQVARYRVRMSPRGASLLVDGTSPLLLSEDELLLLPGGHVLRVTALGHRPLERTLDARGGEREKLELVLEPEGASPASAPRADSQPSPSRSSSSADARVDSGATHQMLGAIALSVGSAALVVSGVTLALALSDKADLDDGCPGRVCPADAPDLEDTRTRYQTLRIVSPVALGVGLVGATVGALLLLSGDDADGAQQASLSFEGLSIRGAL